MSRAYAILLVHFLICVAVFTILPYVYDTRYIPYGLLGASLLITVLLFGWLLLGYPSERVNPFTLMAIIYSVQFSASLYLVKFHKIVSRNELMSYYNNIDEVNLIETIQLAYLFSFIVLTIGLLFARSSLWARIQRMVDQALIDHRQLLLVFVFMITFLEFMLIAMGKVTLQGESLVNKNLKNLEVNPLVAFVNPIACLAVFLSAYMYSISKDKKLIILMIIQFAWFFLWGRRQIVFFAYLSFIGLYYGQQIFLTQLKVKGLQRAFLVGILLLGVVSAAQFYQQLRTIGGVDVLQNVTFSSLKKVIHLYQISDNTELRHASEFNIEIRALSTVAAVAHYDKLLQEGSAQLGNGQQIYNSILKATPSSYFVDKSSVLIMEGLASKLTDGKIRASKDLGGTLILESMIDFGRLGVIIYPIIVAMLIIGFFWFLVQVRNPFVMLWFVITLTYAVLAMTEGSTADLFITMRALLFLLVIVAAIWFCKRALLATKIPTKEHTV